MWMMLVEFWCLCACTVGYVGTFFFWCDIVAIFSLLPEVSILFAVHVSSPWPASQNIYARSCDTHACICLQQSCNCMKVLTSRKIPKTKTDFESCSRWAGSSSWYARGPNRSNSWKTFGKYPCFQDMHAHVFVLEM
jgi:hypothetical protein